MVLDDEYGEFKMFDYFDEIASQKFNEELLADNLHNYLPTPVCLIDDGEEFYVKIPLREYWELGSVAVRDKIMESLRHYAWIDDFYFMMDLNSDIIPKESKCLINLNYISEIV